MLRVAICSVIPHLHDRQSAIICCRTRYLEALLKIIATPAHFFTSVTVHREFKLQECNGDIVECQN